LAANPDTVAEPSGAVATAGFLFCSDQLPKTKLNVAIISGGNIEPDMLEKMLKDIRGKGDVASNVSTANNR
jgi:threonine dehydratase